MDFSNLGISQQLISRLSQMGITSPTTIQQAVIPSALNTESLLAHSQTGSGKTLSYLLPIVERLVAQTKDQSIALIIVPTRELARQIESVCQNLCRDLPLRSCVIYGGVEYGEQREALDEKPNIIVATPGRLLDFMEQGVEFPNIGYFVLDEVDQMVDLGFREPIERITKLKSDKTQVMCFSATLPASVEELIRSIAGDLKRIELEQQSMSVEKIEQLGYFVSFEMMDRLLIHLLQQERADQAIIFTRSRTMADRLVELLRENHFAPEAIHSDRSQEARQYILSRFAKGETSILVATDVIARGIDIEGVSHVFNFGLPLNAEQYIHRIGRCGRAGRHGKAISIFNPKEKPMLDAICKMMKRNISLDNNHPYYTQDVTRALESLNKPKAPSNRGKEKRRRH